VLHPAPRNKHERVVVEPFRPVVAFHKLDMGRRLLDKAAELLPFSDREAAVDRMAVDCMAAVAVVLEIGTETKVELDYSLWRMIKMSK